MSGIQRVLEIGNVKVYERGDEALLVRGRYPCNHRTADGDYADHIAYYVTYRRESEREYERLIEWLEWGFWWCSGAGSEEPIVRRFLEGRCMNMTHIALGEPDARP